MRTIINVECVDQELTITNSPVIASGGVHENFITFKFCSKWDGLAKTAVFYRNENDKYCSIIVDNTCEIPHEVTDDEGTIYFGVFGVSDDITKTSNVLKYKIQKGALTEDLTPSEEPTPDIYQQLLSTYAQLKADIEQEVADRQSAILGENQAMKLAVSNEKAERQAEIAVERARIDNLTTLEAGSTTGDAELQDIRVGSDGTVYENAGTAVRTQVEKLQHAIDKVEDNIAGTEDKINNVIGEVKTLEESLSEEIAEAMTEAVDSTASPIICTAVGEVISITDSANKKVNSFCVNGNTKQTTTTGKNMWNPNGFEDVVIDSAGTTKKGVKVDVAGTYTFSFASKGSGDAIYYVYYSDTIGSFTGLQAISGSITTTLPEYDYFIIYADTEEELNNLVEPQLESGSVATEYEPYTGGAPSPSPSYQQPTKPVKGKNLLLNVATSQTIGGITFTLNANKSMTLNGTATEDVYLTIGTVDIVKGEKYIISGCPANGSGSTYLFYVNYGTDTAYDVGSGATFTAEETANKNARLKIFKGVTVSNLTFYPMIRPASVSDGSYVPYGLMQIKTTGKNVFNVNAMAQKDGIFEYSEDGYDINLTASTAYSKIQRASVSFPKNATYKLIADSITSGGVVAIEQNEVALARIDSTNLSSEFEIGSEQGGLEIVIYNNTSGTTFTFEGVRVVNANVDDAWEAYTETTITLSEAITLNGVGTAKDRIVKQDGVWAVERNCASVVVDGSAIGTETALGTVRRFPITLNKACKSTKSVALNSHLIQKVSYAENTEHFYIDKVHLWCFVNEDVLSNYDSVSDYMNSNPMTVVYELATSTFEELPEADQTALNSLATFYHVTNISCDEGADMEVSYVADTKIYIDNKIAECCQAILNA